MSEASGRSPGTDPRHYSYAHYADPSVAAEFDARRFGGPIGEYLLESQARLMRAALTPASGPTILDVGTGTGRAALTLANYGARVVGVDASAEMLSVARARAGPGAQRVQLARADAHSLPFADRSFDAAVSLRVLMHALDWRLCVAELCRVARWRVVLDFPALASFAALESGARRLAGAMGRPVEPYRVIAERHVTRELLAGGFHIVVVHRQFVLPIALHKAIGQLAFTRAIERGLRGVGLLGVLGSPVTMVAER